MTLDDRVVAIAREWVGTPYHHQASNCGIGCDCIGLVRGVYREIYGIDPQVPPYAKDWGEAGGQEKVLEAGDTYLIRQPTVELLPGRVVAFRWRKNRVAKHVAIMSYSGRMIHAYNNVPVTEVPMSRWWKSLAVASFRFPEI